MAIDILHGTGYRIVTSQPVAQWQGKTIGHSTTDPDGFTVLILETDQILVAAGGFWTDGGTFPSSNFTQEQFDIWMMS